MSSQRVVVGVDFSECSLRALDAAISQAGDGELHALCVVERDGPQSAEEAGATLTQLMSTQLSEKARQAGKLRAFVHVRRGAPAFALATLAEDVDADLLVVGTHGRRGVQRLWNGSVAERVLRLAPCPVLVARTTAAESTEIEPELPCPACKATRTASNNEQWWCEAHRSHAHKTHGYSRHLDYGAGAQPLW